MRTSKRWERRMTAVMAAALGLLAFAGVRAHAQITVFTAAMNGSQVVPPSGSPATGFVVVTLDQTLNTLNVVDNFAGLIGGPATAAHIHCCTPPGVNAIVAVPFNGFPATTSGTYTHFFDLTDPASFNSAFITANGGSLALARAALIAGMFAGQTYTNIHDPRFPGGEISGQLVVATPEPASLALFGSGLALCLGAMSRRGRRE